RDRRPQLAMPRVELPSGLADDRAALTRRQEHVLGFGLSLAARCPARIVELVADADLLAAHGVRARHQPAREDVGRRPHDADAVANGPPVPGLSTISASSSAYISR